MTRHETTEYPIAHGGRLEAMRLAFPNAPEPWIDLSTGINPLPYPIRPLPPDCFTRLPEPEAIARLGAVAATAYGAADPAMVVAAPGTQILIDLLPRLFTQPTVAILGSTYAEHAAAWARAGSAVTTIDDPIAASDQSALVVCNPNNPDGRILAPQHLLALANRLAARGGLLVVDEAFADLATPGTSLVPALPHPAIVILRSFGKTYGLAGVRLGFALAAPARAATIRAALGPWAISGPAIAIGMAGLADRAWLAETRHRLDRDAAALDRLLIAAGMTIIGGTLLYRLAATPHAARWFDTLGRAGILTRTFDTAPHWLRFGMPGEAQSWARLAAALDE